MKITHVNTGSIQEPLPFERSHSTLSVCMIVRDEEEQIGEVLEMIQPIADEIVVVDTGSVDGTVEILKHHKVKILHHQWEDDFSSARNVGLGAAACSWILWLDADDRLNHDSLVEIKQCTSSARDRAFHFQLINSAPGVTVGEQFYQLRLFPNHPNIRFEGAVHETVNASVHDLGLHEFFTVTKIWHVGYQDAAARKAKATRNLRILKGLPRAEEDPWNCVHAADAHALMGEYGPAAELYQKGFEHPAGAKSTRRHEILPLLVGRCLHQMGEYRKALNWYHKEMTTSPERADSYYYAGEIYQSLGDGEAAERLWHTVLDKSQDMNTLGAQPALMRMFAFDKLCTLYSSEEKYTELSALASRFLHEFSELIEPRFHLAKASFHCGHFRAAIRCLEEALQMYPQADPEYWELAFTCYKEVGDEESLNKAKKFFNSLTS